MKTNSLGHVIHATITVGLVGLAGCGTPTVALKLATDTGARASQFASRLADFADAKGNLAELRTENMATTVRQYELVEYEQARLMEAMRLGGQTDKLALYNELATSSEKLAKMKTSIPDAVEKQRKMFLASQAQLKVPIKELTAVSQSLVALGQEMGFKAW